jgi:8-oxo-dGTP pyrophosphatase MutT (NUDIX family)
MYPPIPAATLILLRDVPGAAPQIPMVGRGAHMAFAANRMVFPGGRVDDDDRILAGRPDLLVEGPEIDPDDLAHRITAIRETIEEIGLAPGIEGLDNVAKLAAIRAALHAGEPLSLILEQHYLRLDPHGLHPFSRWLPEHELKRRFDTRFYIARAPELGEAVADGTESTHIVWGSAAEHIASGGMIFPTLRNLERIGLAKNFESAVAYARSYPIDMVTPWFEERDGERWLHIPSHLGYPVDRQRLSEIQRDYGPSNASTTREPG